MVFGGPWVFEPGHRNSQWERLRKGCLSCQNMKHHYPTPPPPPPPRQASLLPELRPLLIQPWGRSPAFPTSWSMEAAFMEPSPTLFIFFDLDCAQGSVGQLQGDFLFLLSGRSLPESALSDAYDILVPVIVIATGLSLSRFPVNNIFVIMKFRDSWKNLYQSFSRARILKL